MKNISFILLCSLIFLKANSQSSSKKDSSVNFNTAGFTGNVHTSGMWVPGTPIVNDIKGSVYLFPDFLGKYNVISKNGNSSTILNCNYNLKTKTLESFVSKDSVFQYDLDKIDYVVINNNKYKVNGNGDLKGLSLEIYKSDNVQFLKYFYVVTTKPVINPMANSNISEAEYVKEYTYFMYIKGKEVKMKLKKSDILNALSDKKNAVMEYVKSSKLEYSSEEDICKILTFYESIL